MHKLNTQLNTKTKRKQLCILKRRKMENTGFLGFAPDSSPVAKLSNAHGMMGIGRRWNASGHSHDPLRYAHLFLLGTVEESGFARRYLLRIIFSKIFTD